LVFEGTLLAKRDYFIEFEGNKICYEKKFILVNRVINGDSLFTDHVVEILSPICREKQIIAISHDIPPFLRSNNDTCIYFVNRSPVSDDKARIIREIDIKYTFYGKSIGVKKDKENCNGCIMAFEKEFKSKDELLLYIESNLNNHKK